MGRLDHSSHPQAVLGDDPLARFAGRPVGLGILGLVLQIFLVGHRAAKELTAGQHERSVQQTPAKMRQEPTYYCRL